ncbi:MAG: phosphoglycerate kinase [Bacillota bacterium]|nr:phosphoglycerate kinase [Bacillota bacterium]
MRKKTVRDLDLAGKRVLVRVDFNVPVDEEGRITDDARIRAALPTIQYILRTGGKVILVSHFGRPEGKPVPEYRLDRVAERLAELLEQPVRKLDDCVGPEVERAVQQMKPGEVILLENVRFHPEEEENDPEFARALASLADVYVNDAFGTAHRAHASTAGVARYLPSAAGFLLEKELEEMSRALEAPARPLVAILGGKKVSDKIGVIENLLGKVDALLIGGGMAFTFLRARGLEIGRSILDREHLDFARRMLAEAQQRGVKLVLPVDVVVAERPAEDAVPRVVPVEEIPPDLMGLDIGPRTCRLFEEEIARARTVIWNGPPGVFELKPFAEGTRRVALALANSRARTIVGGGDTAAAVEALGVLDRMTHVSTGGGASLKLLEGKELPAVEALADREPSLA